ncbi:hypothetical protein PoB_004413100 [Plakobranchus ocellatus]|uniref:Uncharacterized protein n=1 Tax=Plakobranchus ocellatus TaxID=259542 RepID=A0AAV4BFN7_9GAST|nr:hypothetical protein PoB_004413100 [Plakobranchus ocellatus]
MYLDPCRIILTRQENCGLQLVACSTQGFWLPLASDFDGEILPLAGFPGVSYTIRKKFPRLTRFNLGCETSRRA